jgi:hypothetical protein
MFGVAGGGGCGGCLHFSLRMARGRPPRLPADAPTAMPAAAAMPAAPTVEEEDMFAEFRIDADEDLEDMAPAVPKDKQPAKSASKTGRRGLLLGLLSRRKLLQAYCGGADSLPTNPPATLHTYRLYLWRRRLGPQDAAGRPRPQGGRHAGASMCAARHGCRAGPARCARCPGASSGRRWWLPADGRSSTG